ncbi:MAG: inositol monophosphatase [Bacteroidetes bacterium CG12_big_fil_rev_8_21_14_0_65_60_17]|nr:MAG: inositol monophosphatase [Bacteroidetes bacterium CG12_big_fil_rev_8_21_14_0_65_60_17]
MSIPSPDFKIYETALRVGGLAAREAGAYILSESGAVSSDDIFVKGTHDLVSRVDHEAQRIITAHIAEAFPRHHILAEEGDDNVHIPGKGYTWIIDPLDGTTNFLHGVPPWAVSIALAYQGEPQMGIVFDVTRNELFTAAEGMGAFVNGQPCRVSDSSHLNDSLLSTGFPYRDFEHMDAYLSALGHFMKETRGVRRPGCASIDLAWVAAGRFDGFFESGLHPWDVAAGMVLVREAGGRLSNYEGGGDLTPLGGQIIASNGHIHDHMAHILQPVRNVLNPA